MTATQTRWLITTSPKPNGDAEIVASGRADARELLDTAAAIVRTRHATGTTGARLKIVIDARHSILTDGRSRYDLDEIVDDGQAVGVTVVVISDDQQECHLAAAEPIDVGPLHLTGLRCGGKSHLTDHTALGGVS